MVLVVVSFSVKLTFHKPMALWATALMAAAFTGMSRTWAVEQSKAQIADWIADTALMADVSVLLTVDVAIGMAFCCVTAANEKTRNLAVRVLHVLLKYIPGLLIFPVLFATLVYAIFSLVGMDFDTVAWGVAILVLVALPALAYGIKWALPEQPLRLELLFMLNALVALLGIIATVNGKTAVSGTNSVDVIALSGVIGLLAVGGVIGYLLYLRKERKLNRK
jgi:hypothetical protein